MTTDDRRPNGPGDDPTSMADHARFEAHLRQSLESEADRIRPPDRLSQILAVAHTDELPGAASRKHQPRWGLVAAAAAAVLAVASGTVWLSGRPGVEPATPVTAATTTVTSAPAPSTAASATAPTPTTTSAGPPAPPPAVAVQAVPVYYVGPRLGSGGDLVLFREFVRASVTTPVSPETRARAALELAVAEAPAGSAYDSLWARDTLSPRQRVTLVDVEIGEADRITISLSGPAPVSPDDAALAVQQLVWTAQAAAGQGNVPVRFVLEDGSATVAGTLPADQDYLRPSDALEVGGLLAPLWIDNPARGQVLTAGRAITVTGQASTFEATLSWQLLRGSTVLHEGFTTATAGAPARGEFTFTVPALPAGDYVVRAFEVSMKDGSDFAEQRIPFSVR